MAFAFTFSSVGAMTNSERNSDSPIRTWLGGDCCRPIAWRRIDSTIRMRVKLVIISTRLGRMVSRPMIISNCKDMLMPAPPVPPIAPNARSSAPGMAVWAWAMPGAISSMAKAAANFAKRAVTGRSPARALRQAG